MPLLRQLRRGAPGWDLAHRAAAVGAAAAGLGAGRLICSMHHVKTAVQQERTGASQAVVFTGSVGPILPVPMGKTQRATATAVFGDQHQVSLDLPWQQQRPTEGS